METKGLTKSMTLWGGAIVTVLILVLPLLGKADIAAVLQEEQAGLLDWFALVGGAIGSVMVFIGRIRATTKITPGG